MPLLFGSKSKYFCSGSTGEPHTFHRCLVRDVHQVGLVVVNFGDDIVKDFDGLELLYIFDFDIAHDGKVFFFVAEKIKLGGLAINFNFEVSREVIFDELFRRDAVAGFQKIQLGFFSLCPDSQLQFIHKNPRRDLQGLGFFIVVYFCHGDVDRMDPKYKGIEQRVNHSKLFSKIPLTSGKRKAFFTDLRPIFSRPKPFN